MDVLECIATRRSIRRFLDIPVDQETIMTVVEAATHAPSSGNLQDWRFVVVEDKAIMKSVSDYCLGQDAVHNAAFLIVACSDPEQTERHYGLRGERLYTVQNCAAATQNMLLAAHALGLGGTWVGSFDEDKIRALLRIPVGVRPQAVLAFGYPAEVPGGKTVRDLAMVTFFNSYGSRIKNVHRVLRDYHVDWEKRINSAHTAFARLKERALESAAGLQEKMRQEGAPMIDKYKKRIVDSLKPRDQKHPRK